MPSLGVSSLDSGRCGNTAASFFRGSRPLLSLSLASSKPASHLETIMRAEAESLVESIKQSAGLLRRHL